MIDYLYCSFTATKTLPKSKQKILIVDFINLKFYSLVKTLIFHYFQGGAMDHISGRKISGVYDGGVEPTEGIHLDLSDYDEKSGMSLVRVSFNINGEEHQMRLRITSPDMRKFIGSAQPYDKKTVRNIQKVVLVAQSIRNLALDRMAYQSAEDQKAIMESFFAKDTRYQIGETFFPINRGMFVRKMDANGDYVTQRRQFTRTSADFGRELRGDLALFRFLKRKKGLYFALFGSIKFTDLSEGIFTGEKDIARAKVAAILALENKEYTALERADNIKSNIRMLDELNSRIEKIKKAAEDWNTSQNKTSKTDPEKAKITKRLNECFKTIDLAKAETNKHTNAFFERQYHDQDLKVKAREEALNTLDAVKELLRYMYSNDGESPVEAIINEMGHKIHETFYRFLVDVGQIDDILSEVKNPTTPQASSDPNTPPTTPRDDDSKKNSTSARPQQATEDPPPLTSETRELASHHSDSSREPPSSEKSIQSDPSMEIPGSRTQDFGPNRNSFHLDLEEFPIDDID